MRDKDNVWTCLLIWAICVGMVIGYYLSSILEYNHVFHLDNKKNELLLQIGYYFVIMIILNLFLEKWFKKKEEYYQRVFASKILMQVMLSNAIGYLLVDLYFDNLLFIVSINLIVGYILCRLNYRLTELILRN